MNKLEPTYLRYVYDGLKDGKLNAENAAGLPEGFIGLFENEFSADMSAVNRNSILKRLAIWSLFKGSVSTHLVSDILEEDEEDIKTLIDTYSKWFNSPEPGKYILYHDRLRLYFLQKLSYHEVQSLNEKLISYFKAAYEANKADEAEEYALEHLSSHMFIESQLDNNYDDLHDFVNHEDLWKKQVRLSKEYIFSQRAVQYAIKEGARRHHEMNTLKSTINSVKLLQEEQQSISQIFDLLNDGDIIAVKARLDRVDDENRLKLSMLLIHDLLFGQYSEKDFKKEACHQILISINEINRVDITWSYSLITAYYYHLELKKNGIDSAPIFNQCKFIFSSLLDYKNSDDFKKKSKQELVDEIKSLKIDIQKYQKKLHTTLPNSPDHNREKHAVEKSIEYSEITIQLNEKKIHNLDYKKEEYFLYDGIDVNEIRKLNNKYGHDKINTCLLLLEHHFEQALEKNTEIFFEDDIDYHGQYMSIEGDDIITETIELIDNLKKPDFNVVLDSISKKSNSISGCQLFNLRLRLNTLLLKESKRRTQFFKNIKQWHFRALYENYESMISYVFFIDSFWNKFTYFDEIASNFSDIHEDNGLDISLLSDDNYCISILDSHHKSKEIVEKVAITDELLSLSYYRLSRVAYFFGNPEKSFFYLKKGIFQIKKLVDIHGKNIKIEFIDGTASGYSKYLGPVFAYYSILVNAQYEFLIQDVFEMSKEINKQSTVLLKVFHEIILLNDSDKISSNLERCRGIVNTACEQLIMDGYISKVDDLFGTFFSKKDESLLFLKIKNLIKSDFFNQNTFDSLIDQINNFDDQNITELLKLLIDKNDFNNSIYLISKIKSKTILFEAGILLLNNLPGSEININSKNIDTLSSILNQLIYQEVDDLPLEKYSEEIEKYRIRELHSIGCYTAKSVLEISDEELSEKIDLDEKYIKEIKTILTTKYKVINLNTILFFAHSSIKYSKFKDIVIEFLEKKIDLLNQEKSLNTIFSQHRFISNLSANIINKDMYLDKVNSCIIKQLSRINTIQQLDKAKLLVGQDLFQSKIDLFKQVANKILLDSDNDCVYDIDFLIDFEAWEGIGLIYSIKIERIINTFHNIEAELCNQIIECNLVDRKFELEEENLEKYTSHIGLVSELLEFGFENEARELEYILGSNFEHQAEDMEFQTVLIKAKSGLLNKLPNDLILKNLTSVMQKVSKIAQDLYAYYLSKIFISNNHIKTALNFINKTHHNYFKSLIFLDVAIYFYNQNKIKQFNSYLDQCYDMSLSLSSEWRRNSIFLNIAKALRLLGKDIAVEKYIDKFTLDAYKLVAKYKLYNDEITISKDSEKYAEIKKKVDSIKFYYDTELPSKLKCKNIEINTLNNEEIKELIDGAWEGQFRPYSAIKLLNYIKYCADKKLSNQLIFIQKNLEACLTLYTDDYDTYFDFIRILLCEIYLLTNQIKKNNRMINSITSWV